MVEGLRAQGIRDERVLGAMNQVPRHAFVEEALAGRAYENTALPLGFQQTISQPFVVARMIELMGGQPVTVQAADLTQALSTGVVSANLTSSATGYDTKSWEQLSHYYDIQAWLPKNIVFVSQKAFDALDQSSRDALLKAAAAAEERGWKVSEEKTAWYIDQLKANKMKVQPAPEALQAELLKVGEKMTAEWVEKAGPDGQAILDAYRKLK